VPLTCDPIYITGTADPREWPFNMTRYNFFKLDGNQRVCRVLAEMQKSGWIDRHTRALSVEMNFYNANFDISTYIRFQIDIGASGRIHSSVKMYSARLNPYNQASKTDKFRFSCEIAWLLGLLMYTRAVFKNLISQRLAYFGSFWNLIELVNLSLYITSIVYWSRFLLIGKEKFREPSAEYFDMLHMMRIFNFIATCAAWNMVVAVVTLFKYLQINKRMSLLWDVLSAAGRDIIPFMVVLTLVTIGFTFAGHWLFGFRVQSWHNFGASFSTLLRSMSGDLDYQPFKIAAPNLAIIFTVAYIIIVSLVLTNVFVAILTDAYQDTRSRMTKVQEASEKAVLQGAHTSWSTTFSSTSTEYRRSSTRQRRRSFSGATPRPSLTPSRRTQISIRHTRTSNRL